jgi:hypothetical protein
MVMVLNSLPQETGTGWVYMDRIAQKISIVSAETNEKETTEEPVDGCRRFAISGVSTYEVDASTPRH